MQLGGVGVTVQIDESLMVKAKYHRGRNLHTPHRWIFGAYDMATHTGYVQFVDNVRNAATLLPIIQRVVLPGGCANLFMCNKIYRKIIPASPYIAF